MCWVAVPLPAAFAKTWEANPHLTPVPQARLDPPPACGQVFLKILGGHDSEEGKWPWQVSLRVRNRHVCGASLVTERWVLTAGHCILSRYQYSVMMGDRKLQGTLSGLVVPVSRVVVHPQFSTSGTVKNDLALLRLRYPVNFTGVIQPICIPEKTFRVQAGTRCWVTGWGRKQEFEGPLVSEVLQEIDQYIMYYEKCNGLLQMALRTDKDLVQEGVICGYNSIGKDSCQGDSGGPLVCQYSTTWVQVGIVSWGVGCGRNNTPGVYTETALYAKWLVAVVNKAASLYPVVLLLLLCVVLPLGLLVTL
ncbi:serine protease 42-like isoform X1 [Bos indicus]|uniref:Serine protease 42-like isoform X1 n=1 Tax=Bos indicus TaxID=9915 RepID=A0ABM4RBG5_BOSIN|nr:serine protease 42-like isoform X1 [Bos indicus x Bos taurus]XP_061252979.1 serine protease 42-like isoform X2 [Bos javanicus]